MAEYARYEPEAPHAEPAAPLIRLAVTDDAGAISRIYAKRHDEPLDEVEPKVAKELANQAEGTGTNRVFVAVVDDVVTAYGRLRYVVPGEDAQPPEIPEGWYLMGVIVDAAWRRRGIAAALGRHRLTWIAERAAEAFCFTNKKNLSALALHRSIGFEPVDLEFAHERAGLAHGAGQMLRCALPRNFEESR